MTKSISESNTNINSQTSLQTISQTIEKLRAFSEMDVREYWRCFLGDMSVAEVFASDFSGWETRELNAKGHIAWEKGKKVLWLAQKLIVPPDLQGYPLAGLCLRLALVWWADSAQIYINGSRQGEGDLFDFSQRVLLTESVNPGDEFTVALRLVSPGHDNGALVSSKCVYETVGNKENKINNLYPGFVASELAIVQLYCQAFAPEQLDAIAEEINRRVAQSAEEEREERKLVINKSLTDLQNNLQSKIRLEKFWGKNISPPNFPQNPQSKIQLVGHAHLDMAWLWPVSETWEAAKNTFASVLKLQEDFPELIFCHSTPALYAWVEENCPDLFAQIKKAVKNNVWEIVGAFWVEPELNIISGESIARQLLYGQRYVKEKFGELSTVAWLPDSFGFCWTLPQFMVSAGVEYFVTQKLIWNDTTEFPHGAFWWRSPDGSEIFSLMSAPIGEGIDPVKMVEYAIAWEKQTGLKNYLWLPGVGDHGGGPTRDMLEIARRWKSSTVCPEFEFTTVEKYLEEIKEEGTRGQGDKGTRRWGDGEKIQNPKSPIQNWNDELYLEFHRGCYTTHGDQKLYNRLGENLLYEAELFASLASITCGVDYPKAEIEAAWKKLLFNQFHDILPGSSIPEVYEDAEPEWQEMQNTATEILEQSLQTLANSINLSQPPKPDGLPVVVFNSLNWQRSEVVYVSLPEETNHQQWQVYDSAGNKIASQIDADSNLLFLANDIPGIGYRSFWLTPQETPSQNQSKTIALQFVLDNEFLRVVVNEETGDLKSVFDKLNNREILSASGNQLQAFKDEGQYWDAWNIDPNYSEHILPPLKLKSIEWLEQGLLQQKLRVVRQLGKSEFIQDYILQATSPVLKIQTKVNWLERHVLVKAAFPLNLEADFATYEIPCGAIQRTTKPQTAAEKAKWEVPALRWADLTEEGETRRQGDKVSHCVAEVPSVVASGATRREIGRKENSYGVSLLNDCKYGYDAQPSQLRLSLLRSPEWPNPEADKGSHEFSYGLYPHTGSWEKAQTVKRGYEFNQPLKAVLCENNICQNKSQTQTLKEKASFINISGDSADNLILMAFKQAEDNPQQWILRCYESIGEKAEFQLTSDIGLNVKELVDLLERPLPNSENSSESTFTIKPWKIASFAVNSEQ
ncbi:glycosyl hydrolase 38 protein [Calothrix parasitica NIES-267]|uniref:Glycosyl hydrolase 38 protein n=1 Tax=Calothrix parasitica NIES-267 TaxID=1973488 RepID=A0A1Z4LSG9_9CYAN|nr:glycosyl hydrolase 38 protein [Calothrix parasitica NIES-267]